MTAPPTRLEPPHRDRRRWLVLAVLCASVFVVVLDGTIVNVALPTLATELGASTSQLQWIVDAYVLVFAGLLMAAGSLGDRFGRKGVLQVGLVLFATFSAFGAIADSPGRADRLAGGDGHRRGADVPRHAGDPRQRLHRRQGAGRRRSPSGPRPPGVAVALGPVTGGWLLEHFWWGSVLMINVPVDRRRAASRSPWSCRRRGTRRSSASTRSARCCRSAAIGMLVWAVIEGPVHGWTSTTRIAAFAAGAALLAGFVAWERRTDHPMLDVSVFTEHALHRRQRRRDVRLLRPLRLRLPRHAVLPVRPRLRHAGGRRPHRAVRRVHGVDGTAVGASSPSASAPRPSSPAGLVSMAVGFAISAVTGVDTPYWRRSSARCCSWAAASASSRRRPPRRSWARCRRPRPASARPSTTPPASSAARSASPSSAACSRRSTPAGSATPSPARRCPPRRWTSPRSRSARAEDVARQAGARPGRRPRPSSTDAVNDAFVDGWHAGSWVCVGVVLLGALVAWRWLPARAARTRARVDDPSPSSSRRRAEPAASRALTHPAPAGGTPVSGPEPLRQWTP